MSFGRSDSYLSTGATWGSTEPHYHHHHNNNNNNNNNSSNHHHHAYGDTDISSEKPLSLLYPNGEVDPSERGGISAGLDDPHPRAYRFNLLHAEKKYGNIIYHKKILRVKSIDNLSAVILDYSTAHLGISFGILSTYSFLAREYIRIAGLSAALEAVNTQPAWSTEFGSQEDIDARKHYSNVLTFTLMQHISGNSVLGRKESVEDFSCPGRRLPAISVRDYIDRIMKYTPGTKEMYIVVLIYIDRLIAINDGFRITEQNVHRVVVTAIVVASKFFDDLFYTNKYLASVAGVPVDELNTLEIAFLNRLKYNLAIDSVEFTQYRKIFEQIVSFARSNEDLYAFYRTVFSSFRSKLSALHPSSTTPTPMMSASSQMASYQTQQSQLTSQQKQQQQQQQQQQRLQNGNASMMQYKQQMNGNNSMTSIMTSQQGVQNGVGKQTSTTSTTTTTSTFGLPSSSSSSSSSMSLGSTITSSMTSGITSSTANSNSISNEMPMSSSSMSSMSSMSSSSSSSSVSSNSTMTSTGPSMTSTMTSASGIQVTGFPTSKMSDQPQKLRLRGSNSLERMIIVRTDVRGSRQPMTSSTTSSSSLTPTGNPSPSVAMSLQNSLSGNSSMTSSPASPAKKSGLRAVSAAAAAAASRAVSSATSGDTMTSSSTSSSSTSTSSTSGSASSSSSSSSGSSGSSGSSYSSSSTSSSTSSSFSGNCQGVNSAMGLRYGMTSNMTSTLSMSSSMSSFSSSSVSSAIPVDYYGGMKSFNNYKKMF